MLFFTSAPCAGDLPHHQQIPERYNIISGDQPDLETHKGNHKAQQLRINRDAKGTSDPTQLPSNSSVFKGQLSLLKVGHSFYIKAALPQPLEPVILPVPAAPTAVSKQSCAPCQKPSEHPRTELESLLYPQDDVNASRWVGAFTDSGMDRGAAHGQPGEDPE